jgi:ABC-type nickel/cobalt efflux system permease component RcnA
VTSLITISALGFFLGMRHATDPDHVIAITTIVARQRSIKSAAVIGAVWGIGHTLTILAVGGAIILFTWVIPPRVGLSMELAVGLMLIILGIMNLWGVLRIARASKPVQPILPEQSAHEHTAEHVHMHAHSHGDYVHTHAHGHSPETHPHAPDQTPLARLDRRLGGVRLYQLVRPLVVGIVHGLAGSAALALLVVTTIGSSAWSLLYLLVFGVGTVVGMMLITAAIGIPFAATGKHSLQLNTGLRVASGLISLGFGLLLAYQIGFGSGLFTGNPQWSPR